MTDFNTKLDEIVEHAYNAGYSAKDMVKQAIIDLIDKEVITHTHNNWCFLHCPYKSTEGVQIVEEQRNILKGGKYE